MHLRVSDPPADLTLRQAVPQAQTEHLALHLAQRGPTGRERLSLVGNLEPVVLAPQHVRESAALFVVLRDGASSDVSW